MGAGPLHSRGSATCARTEEGGMHRRVTPFGREDGLTMVELMIAMAVLSIGVLAVMAMQLGTSHNNTDGNTYTQANMLAMSQLEILKSRDISFLVPGSYSDAHTLDADGQ